MAEKVPEASAWAALSETKTTETVSSSALKALPYQLLDWRRCGIREL
jgi:hypothetical protein